MMSYFGSCGGGWGGAWFGGLLSVLWWALIIAGFVLLIRLLTGRPLHGRRHMLMDNHSDALEVLKTRYAKGEITKEQFETMKKDIEA